MQVRDAMVRNIIAVNHTASIRKLLDIFLTNRVDSLPVIDKSDTLVGFVTLEDLAEVLMPRYKEIMRDYIYFQEFGQLERIFEAQSHLLDEEKLILVEDCIHPKFISITENESLITAAALMQTSNVRRIPVVNSSKKLVGIISLTDVLLYLFTRHPAKI
ncbi:MAG: CBS domain-containing protein [bacterium]